MPKRRHLRLIGTAVRLALFAFVGIMAVRYFVGIVARQGWGPAAFFGLLLSTGALALVWHASVDLRKAVRRLRT